MFLILQAFKSENFQKAMNIDLCQREIKGIVKEQLGWMVNCTHSK